MDCIQALTASCSKPAPARILIKRAYQLCSLACYIILVGGCASKAPFYDPAQQIEPNDGLLAIMSHNTGYTKYSNRYVAFEFLNSTRTKRYKSGNFGDSVQFGLISLPAGTYYLSGYYLSAIKYDWADNETLDRMKFRVEANKINYFGDFIINFSSLRLQDNQDMTEDFLEQKYPQTYDRYGLVYTLINE